MHDITLTPGEVQRLAGGYKQPAKQLAELHRQGFWRARRARVTGEIILERAHVEAVAGGSTGTITAQAPTRPQVRTPQLRPVR